MEIRYPNQLEKFRGCSIIDSSLSIRLGLNISNIYELLKDALGNIETINGGLKIYR